VSWPPTNLNLTHVADFNFGVASVEATRSDAQDLPSAFAASGNGTLLVESIFTQVFST